MMKHTTRHIYASRSVIPKPAAADGNPRYNWEAADLGNGPKSESSRKVVRIECKRSFGPREQGASCTGAKWGCTGAIEGLGGAKDSWETFALWAHQKSQKDAFAPSGDAKRAKTARNTSVDITIFLVA